MAHITSEGNSIIFRYKTLPQPTNSPFNTNWRVVGSGNGAYTSAPTSATTLGGTTDSNYHMPAYQTLYAWRRTA